MIKALFKHYILIVICFFSSVLLADYVYNKNVKEQPVAAIEIQHILPLVTQYCLLQDCINNKIPFSVEANLIEKSEVLFPPLEREKLDQGNIVTVSDNEQETYHYLSFNDAYYLQIGPTISSDLFDNHIYTSVFYILMAAALFLGFYPLFRDISKLNDVVRKFESSQALIASDFPNSAYFQQIFSTIRGMLNKIGRLVALQKELSDTLSHEVRTSLSSANFTLSAMNDANYAQMKPLLDGDICDIARLVQEYLSFSKQEHQSPSLTLRAQSPLPMIEEYAAKLLRFSDKKVTVCAHCTSYAYIDERYFVRVIKNLIDNALKYANGEIVISLYQVNDMIHIQVEDDGAGIQAEKFDDLFLPFNREIEDLAGYGLGLAIAKKIIDWHQGKILAMNSENLSGAKFIVKLPLAAAAEAVALQQPIDQLVISANN